MLQLFIISDISEASSRYEFRYFSNHLLVFYAIMFYVYNTTARQLYISVLSWLQSIWCFVLSDILPRQEVFYFIFSIHFDAISKCLYLQSTRWNESWRRKYSKKSICLTLSQVQRFGRHILEALLFLRERGIPSHGHVHSGNVILQNGVARYFI